MNGATSIFGKANKSVTSSERGEVRWYKFTKPDVILTRKSAIDYLGEVTVAPVTRTLRNGPSEVLLTQPDGLPADCAVNLHYIQTVSKAKLGGLSI